MIIKSIDICNIKPYNKEVERVKPTGKPLLTLKKGDSKIDSPTTVATKFAKALTASNAKFGRFENLTVKDGHPASIVNDYGGFQDDMQFVEFMVEWFENNAPLYDPEIDSDCLLLVYLATS